MNTTKENLYGLLGHPAPELDKNIRWIDGNGEDMPAVQLADYKNKFIVLFGFQSWCPGCHSSGFPSLKKMVEALKDDDRIQFFVLQTVFEGKNQNTFEKLKETQKQYNLGIPFGQDEGGPDTRNISSTMYNYRTGGTPWFIFIDPAGNVVFNSFHLDADKAIEFLKGAR